MNKIACVCEVDVPDTKLSLPKLQFLNSSDQCLVELDAAGKKF